MKSDLVLERQMTAEEAFHRSAGALNTIGGAIHRNNDNKTLWGFTHLGGILRFVCVTIKKASGHVEVAVDVFSLGLGDLMDGPTGNVTGLFTEAFDKYNRLDFGASARGASPAYFYLTVVIPVLGILGFVAWSIWSSGLLRPISH